MPSKHVYEPSARSQGVFDAHSRAGVGVSARDWGEEQMKELRVVFEWDWQLYSSNIDNSKAGLLDCRLKPHAQSLLATKLNEVLGLPWVQILSGQNLGLHYSKLRDLGTARSARATHFATSSVLPSSASHSAFRNDRQYPTVFGSSPPPTPTAHAHSDNAVEFQQYARDSRDKLAHLLSSTPGNVNLRPIHSSPRESATPSPARAAAIFRSVAETPNCQGSTIASLSELYYTDSSYRTCSVATSPTGITKEKHEADVEYTAKACLDAVCETLKGLCLPHGLNAGVDTPTMMYIVVDGYRCSCSPDIRFSLSGKEEWDADGQYGVSLGEVKRLNHRMNIHNLRGQLTATLLGMLNLFDSRQRETRKRKRKRKTNTITTFRFYWDHLSGFITRLDIHREDVDALRANPRNIQHPVNVRQSVAFNLKEENERLEFLGGIIATCLHRMEKYRAFQDLARVLCAATPLTDGIQETL